MFTATDSARQYAVNGWYVFPIQPGSNEPYAGVSWKKLSTNDPAQVDLMAVRPEFNGCNWALDCEQSGLFVVDVDMKNGKDGEASLIELDVPQDTFQVVTPNGGRHIYYSGQGPNSGSSLGDGIDTRGKGGYVVIPGSIRNGKPYFVSQAQNLLPIPEKISNILLSKKADPKQHDKVLCELDLGHNVQNAIDYLVNRAPTADQGERDTTCYEVACRVRDFGITRETARGIMTKYYAPKVLITDDFGLSEIDWKVRAAYKYAQKPIGTSTAEALFPQLPAEPEAGFKYCAKNISRHGLQPRPWIVENRLLRGYITMTIAPGGVGKSLFNIMEGLAVATGKDITHDKVKETGNVWYYNTEDPKDEIDRRVDAACLHHEIRYQDTSRFFYSSGYHSPLKLAGEDDRGNPIAYENVIQWLISEIKKDDISLMIIDPLIEIHGLNENDNKDMSFVMQILRRIVDETKCAMSIVHHTSQGKDGAAGNVDKARGATAVANACRVAHTLYPMTEKDAKRYNIQDELHWWYVRMDSAKQNLAGPGANTKWYRRVSVENVPGETTGTLEKEFLYDSNQATEATTIQGVIEAFVQPGQFKSLYNITKHIVDTGVMKGTISTIRRKVDIVARNGIINDKHVWSLTDQFGPNGKMIDGVTCNLIVKKKKKLNSIG